jgi:predicted nucleic acid-binding protein
MVVIADTSPINYLLLIEALEVLPQLYRRLLVPEVVWQELQHPNAPKRVAEWAAPVPSWIEIAPSAQLAADPELAELDAGEIEAIALAQFYRPEILLLMDDFKGRAEAERRLILTVGTLGILRDAAALGFVDLAVAFFRLQQTTFRAPPGFNGGTVTSRCEEKEWLELLT